MTRKNIIQFFILTLFLLFGLNEITYHTLGQLLAFEKIVFDQDAVSAEAELISKAFLLGMSAGAILQITTTRLIEKFSNPE